jgi:hypothetical protein
VTTWDNVQRSIFDSVIVEMDPDGEDSRDNLCRGLNVVHPSLDVPRTEASDFGSLAYRNRQILVPCNLPIRFRRFVEKDAFYGMTIRTGISSTRPRAGFEAASSRTSGTPSRFLCP